MSVMKIYITNALVSDFLAVPQRQFPMMPPGPPVPQNFMPHPPQPMPPMPMVCKIFIILVDCNFRKKIFFYFSKKFHFNSCVAIVNNLIRFKF